MATAPRIRPPREISYPTGDGKPMAETDWHRDLMNELIITLQQHYAGDPATYVSGNLLYFYEEGNRRKHVSPDVFMVRGISNKFRDHYLMWREKRGPNVVIELTSRSTKSEDTKKKKALYQDVLKAAEYFLFDPKEDYLKPSMQGFRLVEGAYRPIEPVAGRLMSVELGLLLERDGHGLRLVDPATNRRILNPSERTAQAQQETAQAQQETAQAQQETAQARLVADNQTRRAEQAEAELAQLRRELARLRGESPD